MPSLQPKATRVVKLLLRVVATLKKNKNDKETMMRNEIKIVEDGVIFELEIEEVEEVVAPAVLVIG